MIITIDSYGATLDRRNKSFLIRTESGQRQISPLRVRAIHLRKACNISTPAILLAVEHQVPILVFGPTGRTQARLWRSRFGSHAQIRQAQMRFCHTAAGKAWAVQCLQDKVAGHISVLKWCRNRLPSQKEALTAAIAQLSSGQAHWPDPAAQPQVRAHEARMSKTYWQVVFASLGPYEKVEKRSRQPAEDRFNALLNYAYGILYGEVETAVLTAGLDPQMGVLHAQPHARPAFVFDAIEPFRPWVDRVILELTFSRALQADGFRVEGEAVHLARPGKAILIPAVMEMLEQRRDFAGRRRRGRDQIQQFCIDLAQQLLRETEEALPC